MNKPATPPETVLEVEPELQERVRAGATTEGTSINRFGGLLLDYALTKYECGDLELTQPEGIEPAAP
jgi:hypothetical protein